MQGPLPLGQGPWRGRGLAATPRRGSRLPRGRKMTQARPWIGPQMRPWIGSGWHFRCLHACPAAPPGQHHYAAPARPRPGASLTPAARCAEPPGRRWGALGAPADRTPTPGVCGISAALTGQSDRAGAPGRAGRTRRRAVRVTRCGSAVCERACLWGGRGFPGTHVGGGCLALARPACRPDPEARGTRAPWAMEGRLAGPCRRRTAPSWRGAPRCLCSSASLARAQSGANAEQAQQRPSFLQPTRVQTPPGNALAVLPCSRV